MSKDLQNMEFNFRSFYPGLGKTQSKIMKILEEESKTWGGIPIDCLTAKVYYPDLRGATMWDGNEYITTKSQINTIHIAVKALEKRCLVETRHKPVGTRAGLRHMKLVSIPSDKY
jgi:hypothetical protein